MAPRYTRRDFMRAGTLAAVGAATASGLLGCPPTPSTGMMVFKRSGRGRRVSNAAKKHNANRLYRTFAAAVADAPHPGDTSKIVQRTISASLFNQLFPPNGRNVADLRIHL